VSVSATASATDEAQPDRVQPGKLRRDILIATGLAVAPRGIILFTV
jgi:hypothetical protein